MRGDITIVCVDTKNHIQALRAIHESLDKFPCANVKFFTNGFNKSISGVDIININDIKNKSDYSRFMIMELSKYIDTKYCLTIQHDGYIIDEGMWSEQYLQYDYIGAPWPIEWGYKNRVGNGGFSLRSKNFMDFCAKELKGFHFKVDYNLPKQDISTNEDFLICNLLYDKITEAGFKYAPVEIAASFSVEHPIPEMKTSSFGFHDKFIKRKSCL